MGVDAMQEELGISHIVASLAFSLYALGFGMGPLVLAPISEVYGRNPMYRWSTILFTRESDNLVTLDQANVSVNIYSVLPSNCIIEQHCGHFRLSIPTRRGG